MKKTLLLLLVPTLAITATAVAQVQPAERSSLAAPNVTVNLPHIVPNNNRTPAGRLDNGVLTLRLEAREGEWRPELNDDIVIPIGAFAEGDGPPEIPGPLIRVPAGTEVRTTVRNSLDLPLAVFGLGAERGLSGDSVLIQPGDAAELRFTADQPGTYYYAGRTAHRRVPGQPFNHGLHGALIVDPPGHGVRDGDRIMVISSSFAFDSETVSGLSEDATLAINGLLWPHTELVEAVQGDSLEWRWLNLTDLFHPMHLHGFHFRVDARGNGTRDTIFAPDRRWLAVTETVGPGGTLTTTWSPDRPGNWIFHCHLPGHMTPMSIINTPLELRGAAHGHDAMHQMGGLVVGIRVQRSTPRAAEPGESRDIRLLIRSRPGVYGEDLGYAYVLGGSPEEGDPEALPVPGPTLVLEKDQPVAIHIVNHSHEPAAVHWHGIELESYPDGVPGWSGEGDRVLPAIPVGDSLTLRFTPPRAGTFMYHSHFNEMQQIASGLYGAIIVLEPGERHDPELDRILVFSDGGPFLDFGPGMRVPPKFLNGRADPEPLRLRAGTTYRLRLINIITETGLELVLLDGEAPVSWRAVAKDGAELPPGLATMRPAELVFSPGEIYDFELTPAAAGELRLGFLRPGGIPNEWTWVRVEVR